MTHQQLRDTFRTFFEKNGHKLFPPASLVPSDNDLSALFTVAGMQQFKDFYQHPDQAPTMRIITIQPCIRTIDIDEVGDDTHNTVFEMLGHFSFGYQGQESDIGPYFKKESIAWGWEFLTKELGVNPERIRATYFGGDEKRPADTVSKDLLDAIPELGLVEAYGDNFWGPVGDEGPCGPNVEFYIDNIEVWNAVFNEYFRDKSGNYTPLTYQGVDMGSGLERMLAVLQGKTSVYDTDLFNFALSLVREKAVNYREHQGRIVVDHSKAALFLLSDGVKPGNKGRDYILRRLIRRAVRESKRIGFVDYKTLFDLLAQHYGALYPIIAENYLQSMQLFQAEKEKFLRTLESGTKQLMNIMQAGEPGEINGSDAFKLFDTFGFPIELTQEIAHESNWTVDLDGFQTQLEKHRQQSRAGLDKLFKGGLADDSPQTIAHHTAHHLLLAALRQVLGMHVVQRGSNITSERLRLDISHPEKITDDQLQMVEELVNQKIQEDLPVINEIMDRDKAISQGALAEFGAKYGKDVNVYSIIDQDGEVFSRELCGGPHVTHTGELGHFEILKEEASGAGIRRVRARVGAL